MFGLSLEELFETEKISPPLFLMKTINHLNSQIELGETAYLELPYLFSLPQNAGEVLSYKSKIDKGDYDLGQIENKVVVALLRLFFCELPEPLFGLDAHKGVSDAEDIEHEALFESVVKSFVMNLGEKRRKVLEMMGTTILTPFNFFLFNSQEKFPSFRTFWRFKRSPIRTQIL